MISDVPFLILSEVILVVFLLFEFLSLEQRQREATSLANSASVDTNAIVLEQLVSQHC